ncbi:antibiotic biosynthesis monooxygenase family protein [Leucobacter albus]|uniref:Antibiotic biosynthesis monooxygenase family protein n=1 Tax=Leucobacter albus TaxID=272210 RepID=A0ABW3TM35_9MICO
MSTHAYFFNLFEVAPEQERTLLTLLRTGIATTISQRPGFVSGQILESSDRTRVVVAVVWETAEAARATQHDPAVAETVRQAATIARAQPGIFSLVEAFEL